MSDNLFGSEESKPQFEPPMKSIIMESWWIASELVRRRPELIVYEMHPGGGMYDVLSVALPSVFKPGAPFDQHPQVMLNRTGSLQVHHVGEDNGGHAMLGSWADVLAEPDPHGWVKLIENTAGFTPSKKAPPTTPRSLAYRVMAEALSMLRHDRRTWDVRNDFHDSSEESPRNNYLSEFPLAQNDFGIVTRLGIYSEPQSHFWALLRNGKPVAIISIDGWFYVSDNRFNLMEEYKLNHRKIIPTVAKLLIPIL